MINIDTYLYVIVESIESGIVMRYNYAEGAIEHNLVDDDEVARAVGILRDKDEYRRILAEQDTVKK